MNMVAVITAKSLLLKGEQRGTLQNDAYCSFPFQVWLGFVDDRGEREGGKWGCGGMGGAGSEPWQWGHGATAGSDSGAAEQRNNEWDKREKSRAKKSKIMKKKFQACLEKDNSPLSASSVVILYVLVFFIQPRIKISSNPVTPHNVNQENHQGPLKIRLRKTYNLMFFITGCIKCSPAST